MSIHRDEGLLSLAEKVTDREGLHRAKTRASVKKSFFSATDFVVIGLVLHRLLHRKQRQNTAFPFCRWDEPKHRKH